MLKGFFNSSTLAKSKHHAPTVARCGACKLHKSCNSPKMKVGGKGRRKILIVGEAPTEEEDEEGKHFLGKAGKKLKQALSELGVDLKQDCWMTNALICKPEGRPTPEQIEHCRPNINRTIKELKPRVIITLGHAALQAVLGIVWKKSPGELGIWAGWNIPCQEWNAWICPTFHPSYVVRELSDTNKRSNPIPELMFFNHIEKAVEHERRPWKDVPDYEKEVECILDPDEIVRAIRAIIKDGRPCAFDYEANMLKPDGPESYIVCASICQAGERTIAFPIGNESVNAEFRRFLRSPIYKIGANIKFEDRWSRRKFKTRVRNWYVDTVLMAHALDNRKGITSVKFQSFVLLGQGRYNDHIEPFLKSVKQKGSSAHLSRTPNRIKEIDLMDLLRYCGMDSLLEYLIARKQVDQIGLYKPEGF